MMRICLVHVLNEVHVVELLHMCLVHMYTHAHLLLVVLPAFTWGALPIQNVCAICRYVVCWWHTIFPWQACNTIIT